MAVLRATSESTAPAATALPRTILRMAGRLLLALIALFCVLLLSIRFVIFPELDRYRGPIAGVLERQIGQPVELDGLTGGWDGWNPRLDVSNLRVIDRTGHTPLLTLPEVHLTVAWTSLLFIDLRFKEAVLDRPQLALRRDVQGILHVAGLTFDPAQGREDSALADWLLRQRRILIHDGAVTWFDEQRDAPPLELKRVEFRMENRFGRHRFGLTGAPPAEIAAPLDVRGDVTGNSLAEWRGSSGRLYARLDYVDVAAWRAWLPLPADIKSGKGAVRVWFQYADGEPREAVADLVLTDVEARLTPELQELALVRLDGRLGWRNNAGKLEFFTQQLAFTGRGGARFDPTDFRLVLDAATAAQPASGQIEFSNLQLAPLMQVAENLPLPERWRVELARYNPRGTLAQGSLQWQGEATAPQSFAAKGYFADVGVLAQESFPGFSGLSGSFETTDQSGSLKLASRGMTIDLPRVFSERLALDTLQGGIGWRRQGENIAITLEALTLANAQVSGNASGTYRTAAQGRGTIDLNVQLARADVRDIYRYIPVTVPGAAREWLRRALVSGTASDARLRLVGDLAEFPFADGKKGQFLVTVKAQGVTLDYADRWPPLTDLEGDVRFEGPRVTVDARRGQVFSAALQRARAEIADLRGHNALVRIDGEASGPTADFLRFVAESPVAGWIGHFTDGAEAAGAGKLSLKLELPLGKPEADRVAGEYTFSANRIKLPGDMPLVNRLNGKLAFTERELGSAQLTGDVLGGAARFAITSEDGQVRVAGQGSADLGQLRVEFPQQILAKRVAGTTDWQLGISIGGGASTWTLESGLRGATIDLPPPLAKAGGETLPMQIERKSVDRSHDAVTVRYGPIGQLMLQRRLAASGATVERGLMVLGGGGGEADRPGMWVRGRVDAVNADGWLIVKREIEADGGKDALTLAGVDVTVHELDVFGRRFNDLRIGASHGSDTWQIDLRGRELAGSARWQPEAPDRPNGRIVARLQRLSVPAAVGEVAPGKTETVGGSNPWPEIDIESDSFLLHDRDLGKLELTAQPRGADWQIQRLLLTNDDGKLSAQGWWRAAGRAQQTTLDAELDITDTSRYLARFGLPDAVRGAPTKVHGQLAWAGGPQAFDYPTLSGAFGIQAGQGRFTKLDPGAGKLLGVLSLQSLQRRLTLDFRDLFGEGFAFDEITGDVRIQNGIMKSDNLRIAGPAARVAISGEADIAKETQQLKVRVQPTLSAGVSVGAAVLLLANPIVGAAVGAGSLLAQKVLQDPIEQIFAYEYAVSGGWTDPQVERTGRQPAAVVGPAAAAENGGK
ncbi:MAG: TIGR02099 family protein [Betaproteobacteria bacterium]|nr:MAG: TIGR02099 family protein [Betaproteobacteria bacterium]